MQPGQAADQRGAPARDADGDEGLEAAAWALDPERRVTGAHEARGRPQDPPQRAVEVEVAADGQDRAVKLVELGVTRLIPVAGCAHARMMAVSRPSSL